MALASYINSGINWIVVQYVAISILNTFTLTYLSIIYCGKHNTAASLLQPAQNNALEIVFNLPVRFSTIVLYKNAAKTIIPIIGLYKQRHLMYVF